jgi:homoserine kinase type II
VIQNVASGAFTPWSVRGRYVSLFEDIPGRRLGIFELRARHCRAIGDFLARMHQTTMIFGHSRPNEFSLVHLEQKLTRVLSALDRRRLSRRYAEDVAVLADELECQRLRTPVGPTAVVHGDLFVKSAKFNGDRLVGVFDFDYACKERLTWDLAVALNAWCWEPSVRQMGGPSGKFSGPKLRALIGAYTSVRPLSASEKRELEPDLRLVSLRFALVRMIEFELGRPGPTRPYRDYRHFLQRLNRLREGAVDLLAA